MVLIDDFSYTFKKGEKTGIVEKRFRPTIGRSETFSLLFSKSSD